MATARSYQCFKCRKQTSVPGKLFSLLLDFPKPVPDCPCGEKNELLLTPKFALGAGGVCFRVLDVFHESSSWKDGDKTVTFYPFLVVLENTDDKVQWIWLPYWHVIDSSTKYGERAPWMDTGLFNGLLSKARAKGYLAVEVGVNH